MRVLFRARLMRRVRVVGCRGLGSAGRRDRFRRTVPVPTHGTRVLHGRLAPCDEEPDAEERGAQTGRLSMPHRWKVHRIGAVGPWCRERALGGGRYRSPSTTSSSIVRTAASVRGDSSSSIAMPNAAVMTTCAISTGSRSRRKTPSAMPSSTAPR